MRIMRNAGPVFAVLFTLAGAAYAGQQIDINSLPAGARFCPAPWADNSEFMSSYFSIDAKTGRMTRHDDGSAPVGVEPARQEEEQVLFVSPPISVENVYVPPPGGPAVPPRTMATGVVRQQHPRPQAHYSPVPQQRYAQPQQQYRQVPQQQPRPQYYSQVPQQPRPRQAYPQYPQQQYRPQAYQQPRYAPQTAVAPVQQGYGRVAR